MEKVEFENPKQQALFDAILKVKPTLNFSVLMTALRKKDIKINGKRTSQNTQVFAGDKIEVFLPQKKQKSVPVIFEDQNILIAFKPAGIETTKADKTYKNSESLEEIVGATACHRLDKNTEGLVVLAKNVDAHSYICDAFKQHQIKKTYLAIVSGNVNLQGDKFDEYIKKLDKYSVICTKEESGAKSAKLAYSVERCALPLYLLKIDLKTGRTHQIRCQLAHHKIFVLGDEKYGDKQKNKQYGVKKQQLCATKLKFGNMAGTLTYLDGKTFECAPTFCLENFQEE